MQALQADGWRPAASGGEVKGEAAKMLGDTRVARGQATAFGIEKAESTTTCVVVG